MHNKLFISNLPAAYKHVFLRFPVCVCVSVALRLPAAYRSGTGSGEGRGRRRRAGWRDWKGAGDVGGMSLGGKL